MEFIEPTASLGKLFVDERNGYIGICKSNHYNANKCQWFKLTDIENPGLYCIKPRVGNKYRVLVDCEVVFDVPKEGLHIKMVVKPHIYCKHHTYALNSNYEEWSEPGTISVMRGIITQAYVNAVENECKAWQDKLYMVQENIKEQALCAFMLPRNYTQEEAKQRYHALAKVFHPDSGGDTECMKLLNKYYKILSEDS